MRYTRTDNQPQPVATSDLLNLYLLPNGNLQVSLCQTDDAREEIAKLREESNTFENIWAELFEASRLIGNNWYPCQTFALSSATNICFGAIYPEDPDYDGMPTDFENIWIFDDYWRIDEFELLAEGRSVIFTAVPANKEPNDFCHDDEDGGQFIKKMVDSYLETALWTEEMDEQNIYQFSPVARAKAEKDCREFVQNAYQTGVLVETLDPAKIGRDFWLTRNGHGQGFLNAEYISEAWQRRLDEISEEAGECSVFSIGNDLCLESQ